MLTIEILSDIIKSIIMKRENVISCVMWAKKCYVTNNIVLPLKNSVSKQSASCDNTFASLHNAPILLELLTSCLQYHYSQLLRMTHAIHIVEDVTVAVHMTPSLTTGGGNIVDNRTFILAGENVKQYDLKTYYKSDIVHKIPKPSRKSLLKRS